VQPPIHKYYTNSSNHKVGLFWNLLHVVGLRRWANLHSCKIQGPIAEHTVLSIDSRIVVTKITENGF
jgi:hypothetical protein